MKKSFHILFLCMLLTAVFSAAGLPLAHAQTGPSPRGVKDLSAFGRIVVLDQGRLKPMGTYARDLLLQFSGMEHFQNQSALRWLARLVMTPESTMNDDIFLINNPQVPQALGIKVNRTRRYNFSQLAQHYDQLEALAKEAEGLKEKDRSIVDREVLRLEQNLNLYASLSRSLTFVFPHPDFDVRSAALRRDLGLDPHKATGYSFLDITLHARALYKVSRVLQNKPRGTWNATDTAAFHLMAHVFQWAKAYHDLPLAIIPSLKPGSNIWTNPWDQMQPMLHSPYGRKELAALQDMAGAFRHGRQLPFGLAARSFRAQTVDQLHSLNKPVPRHIGLEILYNRLDLFLWAKIFYGLALLLFLISLMFSGTWLRRIAFFLVIAGFVPHIVGIGMRIVILQRPPVSTLYETFVFVGAVTVLLGLILERIQKTGLGTICAAFCGFVLLLIAQKFAAEGDTLRMLVAVLNSNFWLTTHVLSITTGYAGCCVTALVGHIYLLQAAFKPTARRALQTTYKNLVGTLAFGLAMTFLGTNLGGIWADQSWGRFWGWDPKENGALMIILCAAILFHALAAEMIGPVGLAVGAVFLGITVMWAWFGVNLLGVGLHSYGFTQGTAYGLAVFVAIEVLFLAFVTPVANRRLRKHGYPWRRDE